MVRHVQAWQTSRGRYLARSFGCLSLVESMREHPSAKCLDRPLDKLSLRDKIGALGVASRCSRVVPLLTWVRRGQPNPKETPSSRSSAARFVVSVARHKNILNTNSSSMRSLPTQQLDSDRRAGFCQLAAVSSAPCGGRAGNIGVARTYCRPGLRKENSAGSECEGHTP